MQPIPLGVAEPDFEKQHHEQGDTDAGYPGGHAAPPPEDARGHELEERAEQQRQRDARMNGYRAAVSGQDSDMEPETTIPPAPDESAGTPAKLLN